MTHRNQNPSGQRLGARSAITAAVVVLATWAPLPTAFAAGATSQADAGSGSNSSTELQDVQRQAAQALEAMKNYSAAQRDQALVKGRQLLDAMDERIDTLEARTQDEWNELSRETRQQRRESMAALRQQREDLAQWYGGIRHGSASAWDEVKQGFVKSYNTLSRSFGDAVAKFDSARGESSGSGKK